MDNLYVGLTGEKLLQSMSHKAFCRIIMNISLLAFFVWFFYGLMKAIIDNFNEYWFFLFTTPVWILCLYFPIVAIRKHIHIIQSGDRYEMFQYYGSPDEIASVLSDPDNEQVISSKRFDLTKAYFMLHNDFVTYLPLSEIDSIQLRVTSGKTTQLRLHLKTVDGTQKSYRMDTVPFTSLRKNKQRLLEEMSPVLAQYAPHIQLLD